MRLHFQSRRWHGRVESLDGPFIDSHVLQRSLYLDSSQHIVTYVTNVTRGHVTTVTDVSSEWGKAYNDLRLAVNELPRTFESEGEVRAIPSRRVTELMIELLKLKSSDKLLEIGTGSQSQTLEFAKYCEVTTIELHPVISADHLGKSVYYKAGDGRYGIPGESWDAIVSTCGVEAIPEAWQDQLKDGGRLVVPLGSPEMQKLSLFVKKNGGLVAERVAGYVRFQMIREA